MQKKLLATTILASTTLLTACNSTLQTTLDKTKTIVADHKGLVVGCFSGAAVGYATKGERGALIGMLAGCGIGKYYDHQRKKMKEFAQQSNMDVVLDIVEVSVLDADNKTRTNTKLLSSSFVHDSPMFATGSTKLSVEAKILIENLAVNYKDSGTAVMVVGHSDSSGSSLSNKRLSEKRAQVVADLLVANGVVKDKIYYQGAGESQPIAPNTSIEGRSLNRRVEFVELGAAAILQMSGVKEQAISKSVSDRSFIGYAATQQVQLRNAAYRESLKAASSHQVFIDFDGKSTQSGDSPLYQYLGEPEPPILSFGLFQKTYATDDSSSRRYSCLDSEPVAVGTVKSMSGEIDVLAQHEYVPGMNNSVWLSKVNGHLVSLSGVKVAKDNYQIVDAPIGSVYKNYSGGNSKPEYRGNAIAEAFEGKDSFLYRVYFNDSKRPMECMDLIMPKKGRGKHQAVAGLIYYRDSGVVKAAEFRPKKI